MLKVYRSSCCGSSPICLDPLESRRNASAGIDSGRKMTTRLPTTPTDATNNINKYGWILFCKLKKKKKCWKIEWESIKFRTFEWFKKFLMEKNGGNKPKVIYMERWSKQIQLQHCKHRHRHFESPLDTIRPYKLASPYCRRLSWIFLIETSNCNF